MKWQELYAKAKEKLTVAKALLEGEKPNVEQANALRDEAKGLMAQAEALKATMGDLGTITEPVMPAALPTEPDASTPPEPTKSFNPAYVLRYGDEDDAVKAILKDLHGDDYRQKRWDQWLGFERYLRKGEVAAKSMGHIFTPGEVELAIKEGQDVRGLKTVMVEAQDVLGGYVCPADWRADVIMRMQGLTCVRPRARIITTSRDSVELPKITGGGDQYVGAVRVTWVDETPTAGTAATNVTFGLEKIPVHTVMAETFLSRNLVEDAAFNIVAHLAEEFARAQAIDEDNQFLTGDGNGKPRGFLPSSANSESLSEAESGNASALTGDGVIELAYELASQYRQNAVFIAERATYKTIRKLKTGDGEYIWDRNYQAGQPDRLLGYPVLEQEAMPTVAANAYPILFGDIGQAYCIVDRIGMSVERYLDSTTARINQVIYLCRRRLGGQVVAPWAMAVQKVST